MIEYKTNKDNKDYIEIDVKYGIGSIFASSNFIPKEVKKEAGNIYNSIRDYEYQSNTGYIAEILIPKTSTLGVFLLENTDMKEIIDKDRVVSYEKIVNAFNIAVYEGNPIASEILPLFRGQASVNIKQLSLMYPDNVFTYILENPSFENYLSNLNGEYREPKVYTIYENGEFSQRQFKTTENEPRFRKNMDTNKS